MDLSKEGSLLDKDADAEADKQVHDCDCLLHCFVAMLCYFFVGYTVVCARRGSYLRRWMKCKISFSNSLSDCTCSIIYIA